MVGDRVRPGPDGELALGPVGPTSVRSQDHGTLVAGGWYGRVLFGRSHPQMMGLIADAREQEEASGSRQTGIMMTKVARHARIALRHAALARLSMFTIILYAVLVASMVLAHETRNTVSIYENYLANPTVARAPQQSWGYTPVLYELPEGVKSNLVALDRFVETRFKALGLGQSKSGSSSIHSQKLSAAIMSLFGLIPVVQFGLGQTRKAESRRIKAIRAMACGRVA